jgi:hypothetical protein
LFLGSYSDTRTGRRFFCVRIEEGSGQQPSDIEIEILKIVPPLTAYTMDVYFNVSSDKVLNIRFVEYYPYNKPKISGVEINEV